MRDGKITSDHRRDGNVAVGGSRTLPGSSVVSEIHTNKTVKNSHKTHTTTVCTKKGNAMCRHEIKLFTIPYSSSSSRLLLLDGNH